MTTPLTEILSNLSHSAGIAAAAASADGYPEVAGRYLAESDRFQALALDYFAPKTGASAHAPVITAVGDWPGCTGEVRRYPSGSEACDCGEGVAQ